MVSRRKILSRSRDELHTTSSLNYHQEEDEDDVWLSKEKLYQDHIHEVTSKWSSIDDEIWAKLIVLERNRRVAKAYARAPVVTVNGSDDGFDGFRIGVSGFDNPMRDAQTEEVIKHIGQGFKLKMDGVGNILIKRLSKSGVRVKNTTEESAVSNDILKLPGGLLEQDKPFKIFDMKKFQQNMNRELKRPYPDRRKLESQCISAVAFGANNSASSTGNSINSSSSSNDLLGCPIWIICINIVAIEMLKSKLPSNPVAPRTRPRSMEPRGLMSLPANNNANSNGNIGNGNGNGLRPFGSGSSDEDPYSVAGIGSSGNSNSNSSNGSRSTRDHPPKLPPRDGGHYGPSLWAKGVQQGGLDNKKDIDYKKQDDPYYCGLRARIPNFVKTRTGRKKTKENGINHIKSSKSKEQLGGGQGGPISLPSHPFWWHSRLYNESSGGQMSMGSSNDPFSTNPRSSYRRNPTNFVPYITANGSDEYLEDLSY